MVDPLASEPQTGLDILRLEVWQIFQDLGRRQAVCEKVQHVDDPDPHPADTGTSTALLRVDRDPLCKLSHARTIAHSSASTTTRSSWEKVTISDFFGFTATPYERSALLACSIRR